MPSKLQQQEYDEHHRGPLAGLRVLDLSRLVAGNMATVTLADFGADVIKVERPGHGDDLRHWLAAGKEVYWKVYGRNKRSIELDIRADEGRDILLDLVRHAHVLVENFVPGTLERWKLGPADLHAVNPAIIVLRVSGWGQTGPNARKPGFGTLVEAMSGFAHLNGFPDKPPALPPLALADMIAGLYGAFAVLAAVRASERTGAPGQVIDLSLFESILSILGATPGQYLLTGAPGVRSGNQSAQSAPRNIYACSDGNYVALSGSMQSMAVRILRIVGGDELSNDPRFATNESRVKNRNELDRIIGDYIGARTRAENLEIFSAADVTVGPVYSTADLMTDPFVAERAAIVNVFDPDIGFMPTPNIVPRLSVTPGGFSRPAPLLGEHTAEILAELND